MTATHWQPPPAMQIPWAGETFFNPLMEIWLCPGCMAWQVEDVSPTNPTMYAAGDAMQDHMGECAPLARLVDEGETAGMVVR